MPAAVESPPSVSRARGQSYKQWLAHLGPAVPLRLVAPALRIDARQVTWGVHVGYLRIHAFHAADGRSFRMVRLSDLRRFRRRLQSP